MLDFFGKPEQRGSSPMVERSFPIRCGELLLGVAALLQKPPVRDRDLDGVQ